MSALWSEDGQRNGRAMTMTKYSEIEIETAKALLEHGYKWIARYESGRLFAHCDKPLKVNNNWGSFGDSVCVCKFVPIFQSVRFGDKEPVSLESIVHPQILDDAEKRYLKGVIMPFRNEIKSIEKDNYLANKLERIYFFTKEGELLYLKTFKANTMYKGMEQKRQYTLEELGL